ncbi:MAG: hypothetical protein HQL63_14550 [Magnetococcales bacterium]|nr:hypothetical protein [Magnetococcales bacterium]
MANVGAYWAEQGEVVLMIDMDLAAPGLSYSPLLGEWLYEEGRGNGFNDLLDAYFKGRAECPDQLYIMPPHLLMREVFRPGPDGLPQSEIPWGAQSGKRGRLLAIDAIRDRQDPGAGSRPVAATAKATDEAKAPRPPHLIRGSLPERIPPEAGWGESETPDELALRALALAIKTDLANWRASDVAADPGAPQENPWEEGRGIDRVLIDCRTGFPELLEMALGYLSDRMVLVAGLNDQNREGMRHLLAILKDRIALGEFPGALQLVLSPVPLNDDDIHVHAARQECERIIKEAMREEASGVRESPPTISLLHYTPLLATGDVPLAITHPYLRYVQEVREVARLLEGSRRTAGVIEEVKEQLLAFGDFLAPALQEEFRRFGQPPRKNPMVGLPRWDWPLPLEWDAAARADKRDELLTFAAGIRVDKDLFLNRLSWSISLSGEEKENICRNAPSLSQIQVDQLQDIFDEERQKFSALEEKHEATLLALLFTHQKEWARLLAGEKGVRRFLTAPLAGEKLYPSWEAWFKYWFSMAKDLHSEFKDDARSAQALERAITVAGKDPANLGKLALFMHEVRQDMDRAEELYQRALDADPQDAHNLGNFAVFTQNVRQDMDRTEELYRRALDADPRDARILGKFAVFMQTVRQNMERAEELYRRALDADPRDANNHGNFAGLLLARGRREEGLARLRAALDLAPGGQELQVELRYYALVHAPDDHPRALAELKALIGSGARSPGWDLTDHVAWAKQQQDPRAELLEHLAAVISVGADAAVLENSPLWREA